MDLRTLLDATLPGLGYELIDVELMHGGGIRLYIDKPEGVAVEDCATVSNHLTRLFLVENVAYERLEVSSPGLDRLLTKPAHFERFQGQQAKFKLRLPLEGGRKTVVGVLGAVTTDTVEVESEGVVFNLNFSQIDRARLVPVFK
jgi:ribosome maturation factor RimP